MKRVRTRYAPSPTGRMHVGNLRTALYAYLIAKHEGGDFILRIEDTDQERFVEGAIEIIYNTLKMTGLNHDEGPDVGGPVGPYIQSERKHLYMEYAKELVNKGEAYYCFCSKERLDDLRAQCESKGDTFRYDKHCANLSKDEIEKNLSEGLPFVIRQNNPTEGFTTFEDEIYGTISVPNNELDDMVLIKSDGLPTYNFANVVDDHLMGITHVVRGNEYLSSSPKYNRLYAAFGWEVPVYVHCPLITNEEHQKLSKRSGHSSFEDLYEQGYLIDTIVNFVSLLGWNPGTNEEMFKLEELVKIFDYRKINKSPAVFDMQKLKWMNGEYIKKQSPEEFFKMAEPYIRTVVKNLNIDLLKISNLVQSRTEVLTDIPERIDFIDELPEYSTELYVHKKMKTTEENSLESLKQALPILENIENWNATTTHDEMMKLVETLGIKNGQMLWPIRTAISGKAATPGGAFEIAEILGKEESLKRIRIGIEKLTK